MLTHRKNSKQSGCREYRHWTPQRACNYGDDSISSYSNCKAVKMDSVRTDGLLNKYMNTDYQFLDLQLQELNQKRSHLKPLSATKWRNPSDSTAHSNNIGCISSSAPALSNTIFMKIPPIPFSIKCLFPLLSIYR